MSTEKRTIFLSDAHLNDRNQVRQQRLVSFLKQLHDLDRLYILGDLFDFWFGYKTVIFRFFLPVLCELNRLQEEGCELVYVLGNHDFYLGSLFRETIPMRIISAGSLETIDDKKVYLIHGDGIDKGDWGYRLLRFLVRSRPIQFFFRWIHPDIGWYLARILSKSSRTYTSWKKFDQKDVYLEFGIKRVEQGADACIMAHSHNPLLQEIQLPDRSGIVVILGDWIENCTFLQYTPQEGFQFLRYDRGTIEFVQSDQDTDHGASF